MQPPLILSEHGSLALFADRESLLRYVEPLDVSNNEYVVYDSTGRLIRLKTTRTTTKSLSGLLREDRFTPVIAELDAGSGRPDELRLLLVESLAAIDGRDAAHLGLDELIEAAVRKYGYTL